MKRICDFNRVIMDGDSGIIFNGLNGAVLKANSSVLNAYELAHQHQPLDRAMVETLFPDQEIRNILEREHLLVPVNFDEYTFIDKARNIMVNQDLGTNVEFIVTYRCNFRCIYCYAGQAPPHMSEDMAQRAADFASEMAQQRNSKAMKIQFIGGEPLLNPEAIDIICAHMSALRDERELIMRTSLTTNGSLLTRRMLKSIRAVGPVDVQITLDGPEPIHNKRRSMKNSNSYQAIVNNIKECVQDVDELPIRINVDYENVEFIPDFLVQMREFLPDDTALAMVPTFAHTEASAHYSGQCFKNNDMPAQLSNIWTVALALGFPPSWNPIPTFMSCGAIMPGSIAIDPLGDIYKCAATYGNKALSVGTVKEGLDTASGSVYDQFVNRDKRVLASGKCRGCSALPVCMGGCSFRSFRKNGVMHEPDCRHDQRECFEDFIRQYFEWHVRKRVKGQKLHNQTVDLTP